ncbi:phosphodiester glycosidase family protein [Streptomyces sp. NPDC015346]|uniref:phosphodiester glycosidase family protein n=1 Tax=Streptomyces sp. NPDC015346 TaxID=3364954 RepID=UPI0037008892
MNSTESSSGRRLRRIAAVPVALATLALTQSATTAATAAADPTTNDVASVLDGLTPHRLVVAEGIERTTYSSPSSPLVVRVAVIDPDLGAVTLDSTVGAAVSVKETTTAMLATVGTTATDAPYVGVNGGYSVSHKGQDAERRAISEDRSLPMVASVQEDVVQGASCARGQNAVVLQHGRPHFTKVTTTLEITSDRKTADVTDDVKRSVDGVNRYPGWIPFCPQGACDRPLPYKKDAAGEPVLDEDGHKVYLDENGLEISGGPYYEDDSEIVVFTSAYGQKTPEPGHTSWVKADNVQGVEVAVDQRGYVTEKRSRRGGMEIPPNGMVLQGIGTTQSDAGAKWLDDHTQVGAKLTYTQRVTDIGFPRETATGLVNDTADDEDLVLDPAYPSLDVINGTHLLMRNAKVAAAPGDNDNTDPRTAIGTDGWGRTLLVTVTSTTDGVRHGVPIYDLAKIMEDLGSVDALNLDGGGSTTFVVDGQVKNAISNGGGVERPVYDSVYAGRGGHALPAPAN